MHKEELEWDLQLSKTAGVGVNASSPSSGTRHPEHLLWYQKKKTSKIAY
jgi:hypothetical protein